MNPLQPTTLEQDLPDESRGDADDPMELRLHQVWIILEEAAQEYEHARLHSRWGLVGYELWRSSHLE